VNKVLLLGLDGMTFDVLQPAFEAGHMNNLRRLLEGGASGVLKSTVPPYTPPGWTSIFTGVNPGKHGIFGFALGNIQRPGGLVRLDRVAAPAIWNAANAQGTSIGLFNIPMTYPPPPVDGFAVAGMLTPEEGGETPSNFTHPDKLAGWLGERVGNYAIDIKVDYEQDWRSTSIIDRLSINLQTKRKALKALLDDWGDLPMLFAVLEAPDRLMHVHYKYIDPRFEHFSRPEAKPIRDRAWHFFDEMDEVVADLVEWVGSKGYVLTMSDHGFQGKEKSINANYLLNQWGLLTLGGAGSVVGSSTFRATAQRVKKLVPKGMRKRVKSVAHSSIDWTRTKAFSAPIPQQGIYVNLAGREPHGIVPEGDYEAVRDEIIGRFGELVDPDDGSPVLDRIYRREEVMQGPAASGAPDLFPVCREYSYELSDGLYSLAAFTDYRQLPRGFHHMDGIFGIAGPGIDRKHGLAASLYDIAPTALYLAGLDQLGSDGRVLTELLPSGMIERRPPATFRGHVALAGEGTEASPYSAEDEAQIEESLRNLGYL
jgi:predicted AlkP superfamily phosphohydrolase/phosphomutase